MPLDGGDDVDPEADLLAGVGQRVTEPHRTVKHSQLARVSSSRTALMMIQPFHRVMTETSTSGWWR